MPIDARNASLADPVNRDFAAEVLKGLSAADKNLPCRFFYDAVGSELFEDITRTKDYYPTRTETAILREQAGVLMEGATGAILVEFGSGSSTKTELLLDRARDLRAYVPIDVSPTALAGAVRRLGERFPRLSVEPVVADFTGTVELPEDCADASRIGFFPGSTIGNFSPSEAQSLLRTMAVTLGDGARLILGVDLRKDARRLVAAYNDDEGVTAAFNLNLLARINRELGGTFDLQFFRHEAIWNPVAGRVEMYLISERQQTIDILGRPFQFRAEERIHTENSYKYTLQGLGLAAAAGGWASRRTFLDADGLFAVAELTAD